MDYEKKIEKLRNPYVRGNEGCSVSMIDLLEKINEIIDAMNGEHDPADIYSEDGRLIAKKDESEDERIRKEIVGVIQKHYPNTPESYRWISWLEKQKENPKKADSIPADCTSLAKCEDRDSKYGVFPEDVIVVARACEKLEAHGYPELAHALKNVNLYTKEQKPVDDSDFKTKLAEYLQNNSPKDGQYVISSESILEMAKEELIKRGELKEQNPAEWSEEDEKIIRSIRHILFEHAFENGGVDVNGDYCEDVYIQANDFLLSLRPSWKPSEEQMKAIDFARRVLFETYPSQHNGCEPYHILGELYEQLKKLAEV